MAKEETELLFEHTRRLRKGRTWLGEEADFGSDYSFELDESDEENSETDDTSGGASAPANSGPLLGKLDSTEFEVFPTRYAPSLDSSRRVTASIMVSVKGVKPPKSAAGQASTAMYSPTLFRWLHLNQEFMNFEQFKGFVFNVTSLPFGEKKELLQFFEDIQSHETKRRMGTWLKSSFDKPDQPTSTANAMLWICFPYLSFRRYKMTKRPGHASEHPNLTLMQSYEATSSKERDLQQAATRHTKSDKCFFISQIWCLVLNQHTIITCAQSTVDELRGDIVDLVPSINPCPNGFKTQTKDSPPYLYVHDRGNCIYLLSVERCQSWAEFLSQFVDIEYGSFEIYEKSVKVTSANWNELRIVERARSTQVFLSLTPIAQAPRDTPFPTSLDGESSEDSGESTDESVLSEPDPEMRQTRESSEISTTNSDDAVTARETTISESAGDIGSSTNEPNIPEKKHAQDHTQEQTSSQTASFRDQGTMPTTKAVSAEEPFKPVGLPQLPALDCVADLRSFRVFTWMSVVSIPSANSDLPRFANLAGRADIMEPKAGPANTVIVTKIDIKKLDSIVDDLHGFLSRNKRIHERVAYTRCPVMTYRAFEAVLAHQIDKCKQGTVSVEPQTALRMRSTLKMTRSFANTACLLFQFFLPLEHESVVAAKFWGGLGRIITKLLSEHLFDRRTKGVRSAFGHLCKATRISSEVFSEGRGPVPGSFRIPPTLYRAFISIVILVVEFQIDDKWVKKVVDLGNKIEAGSTELVAGFANGSLSDQEAIAPAGLLSLLIYRLCGDVAHNQEPDLVLNSYQQSLDFLEAEAQRNPRDRSHQVKLVFIKQELKAIMSIVADQESLLQTFSAALGPEGTGWAASLLRMPRDRSSIIVERAMVNCNDKFKNLEYLLGRTETILETHLRLLETTKDIHESASLTFAIVSVIFLPLTAVASILGMNTSDVRDMHYNQWIFWAAGLPLAAVTGLFCLWCTAQLDEFGTWARDRWLRSRLYGRVESIWRSMGLSEKDRSDVISEVSIDIEDV